MKVSLRVELYSSIEEHGFLQEDEDDDAAWFTPFYYTLVLCTFVCGESSIGTTTGLHKCGD